MAKVTSLTAKFKTYFQRFVVTICIWKMNPKWDVKQISIKTFLENQWNAIRTTQELTFDLNIPQSTICRLLKNTRKVSKPGICVLHIHKN